MGKRGILRVTPRFRGKRGCRGSVRSCVLRHGSGENVAAVVLWDLACYATVQGKTWLLCPDSRAGEHVLSTAVGRVSSPLDLKPGRPYAPLQEFGLADGVLADEQDISAPVRPRTRPLRSAPVRRTLLSGICSPCLVSSTYLSQTVFLPNKFNHLFQQPNFSFIKFDHGDKEELFIPSSLRKYFLVWLGWEKAFHKHLYFVFLWIFFKVNKNHKFFTITITLIKKLTKMACGHNPSRRWAHPFWR